MAGCCKCITGLKDPGGDLLTVQLVSSQAGLWSMELLGYVQSTTFVWNIFQYGECLTTYMEKSFTTVVQISFPAIDKTWTAFTDFVHSLSMPWICYLMAKWVDF